MTAIQEFKGELKPRERLMDTLYKWFVSDRVEYSPSLRYGVHIAQEAPSDNSTGIIGNDSVRLTQFNLQITLVDMVEMSSNVVVKVVDVRVDGGARPYQLALLSYYWLSEDSIMIIYVDGHHLLQRKLKFDSNILAVNVSDERCHSLIFNYYAVKRICSSPIVTIGNKRYVVPFAFYDAIVIVPYDFCDENMVTILFNDGFLYTANWALSRDCNIYFPVESVFEDHVFLNPIRNQCTVVYRLNLSKINLQEVFYEDASRVPELLSVVRFYKQKTALIEYHVHCGTSHSETFMLKFKKPSGEGLVTTQVDLFDSVPRDIYRTQLELSSEWITTIYGNSLLIWKEGLFPKAKDDVFVNPKFTSPIKFTVLLGKLDDIRHFHQPLTDQRFLTLMFSPRSGPVERRDACHDRLVESIARLTI